MKCVLWKGKGMRRRGGEGGGKESGSVEVKSDAAVHAVCERQLLPFQTAG